MPESKNRKEHKIKLTKRKKEQMEQNTKQVKEQLSNTLPPVRNVPTWEADATIKLSGIEWEVIFNGLSQLAQLQQAAQGIMSRNILDGTIKMVFQKLDAATMQYGEMTPEEMKPYQEQFSQMIANVKEAASRIPVEVKESVIETNANVAEDITNEILNSLEETKPLALPGDIAPEGAKIITGDFK